MSKFSVPFQKLPVGAAHNKGPNAGNLDGLSSISESPNNRPVIDSKKYAKTNVDVGVYGMQDSNPESPNLQSLNKSTYREDQTQDAVVNGNLAADQKNSFLKRQRATASSGVLNDTNWDDPQAPYVIANPAIIYDCAYDPIPENEYVDFDAGRLGSLSNSEIDGRQEDVSDSDFDSLDDPDHIYESLEDYQRPNDKAETLGSPDPKAFASADAVSNDSQENIRIYVVQELIKTEEDFLHSLDVIVDDIMKPLSERELPPEVKLEKLFGNIEEVRQFSSTFLASLKATVGESPSPDAHVGKVFVEHATEMKEVYKTYCRNYDDSLNLIEKYKNKTKFCLPVRECLSKISDEKSSTLESMLIKPVQRFLKYPLMLQRLLKATPPPQPGDDATYFRELIMADEVANKVASAINEAKRGKELIKRYRSKSRSSSKRRGRFLRGMRKKAARISVKLSHAMNKTSITDEDFDKAELKFTNLGIAVNNFISNCELFLDDFEDVLQCERSLADEIVQFYASDQTRLVAAFNGAVKKIANYLFVELKNNVQRQILSPLKQLCERFEKPLPVISKRADKLLDYENCLLNSDCKVSLEESKMVYDALNQQLLDDLPKFCQLASKMLHASVVKFLQLEMKFLENSLQTMEEVFVMFEGNGVLVQELGRRNIAKQFTFVQNQVLLQMKAISIIPSSFTDKPNLELDQIIYAWYTGPSVTGGKYVRQSSAQQQKLTKKYQSTDLFVVMSSYSSLNKTDISCSSNSLVGVIKRQDPTGDCNRWFCDNGAAQGFLPSNILKSYLLLSRSTSRSFTSGAFAQHDETYSSHYLVANACGNASTSSTTPIPSPSHSSTSTPTRSPSLYSLREKLYGEVKDPSNVYANLDRSQLDEVFDQEDEMLDDTEYGAVGGSGVSIKQSYRVEYTHSARSPLELSVRRGDNVSVILKYDKSGNSDWWMVANKQGTQGYVPYNYLKKL